MEMSENNSNASLTQGIKSITATKPGTQGFSGMPNSHGVKFPTNMTSEYKKELFSKLEEWRKARKEKLAASILAKQKHSFAPPAPVKSKLGIAQEKGNTIRKSEGPEKETVFERLYKNNGKIRKPEANVNLSISQQVPQTSIKNSALPSVKSNKPVKTLSTEKKEFKTLHMTSDSDSDIKKLNEPLSLQEISIQNCHVNEVHNTIHIKDERNKNNSAEVITNKCKDEINLAKSLIHTLSDQNQLSSVKCNTSLALKSFQWKEKEVEKSKNVLRRSISMMFRQKHRNENALRRCKSAKTLHEVKLNKQDRGFKGFQTLVQHDSKIEKGSKNEAVKFVTFATPKNTRSFNSSTHLRSKLETWLKVNGHPLEGYRHLRCFGITGKGELDSGSRAPAVDNSYGKSNVTIPTTPVVHLEKENVTPPTVIQKVDIKDVENWLKELHRLIVELKYPSERCEEWLSAIRKKCTGCSQLPIYWECLAALHESKGDIKSAIEDYERAIIKGGEVDAVGDSLAGLFDKMVIEHGKNVKPKLEKGLDPKNIFKSTIIKFALQQKAIKKLSSEMEPGVREQLYVATPVRRSTRIRTPFKSSDEVASLQTLTPEFRKNITFKPNDSLLQGD